MDATTVARLGAINARFYEAAGAEFSATRRRGWPGWKRVATQLPAREPLRVLDLGCGNGRLIDALRESGVSQLDYLGLDASDALLRRNIGTCSNSR